MKTYFWTGLLARALLFLVGCSPTVEKKPGDEPAKAKDEKSDIQAAIEKLAPEDQKVAKAQQYCAVMNKNRLGSMGVPIKVEVKGQSVFLCCKSCEKRAIADPDKTLAAVEKLKAKATEASGK